MTKFTFEFLRSNIVKFNFSDCDVTNHKSLIRPCHYAFRLIRWVFQLVVTGSRVLSQPWNVHAIVHPQNDPSPEFHRKNSAGKCGGHCHPLGSIAVLSPSDRPPKWRTPFISSIISVEIDRHARKKCATFPTSCYYSNEFQLKGRFHSTN
jgi:hypothetical protein